jgi:hypothetical protein
MPVCFNGFTKADITRFSFAIHLAGTYQVAFSSFIFLNPIRPTIIEINNMTGTTTIQCGQEKMAQTIRPSANPLIQKRML